jgi:hypothetical protein
MKLILRRLVPSPPTFHCVRALNYARVSSSPSVRFDASGLRRTSDQERVPWRARDVTLVWIQANGRVTQAQGIEEKRQALHTAGEEDLLLLAWPGAYRQDIFLVDDRDQALAELEPPGKRTVQ